MASRTRQTTTDYVVVGLSPLLIFLMINSLAGFLMLVLYRGDYPARIGWIVFFFTMGTVGIARVAIEKDRAYSLGYAVALGAATLLVMMRYGNSPVASIILLAVVAYLSDWIVRDCTLIDETADSSDQGLIDSGRLLVRQTIDEPNDLADDSFASEQADDSNAAATSPAPTSGKQRPSTSQSQPGRSVFWLALGALPLYGLGQFFLRTGGHSWALAQKLLTLYLFAALSLLVTTSFLGLRRYLRQRGAEMPRQVSIGWMVGGLAVIAVILGTAYMVPVPGRLLASFELPAYLDSPVETLASQFGWGEEGADKNTQSAAKTSRDPEQSEKEPAGTQSKKGAKPGAANQGNNSKGQPGQQSGGKKGSPQEQDTNDSKQGKGQNQGSESKEQKSSSGQQKQTQQQQNQSTQSQQQTSSSQKQQPQQSSQTQNQQPSEASESRPPDQSSQKRSEGEAKKSESSPQSQQQPEAGNDAQSQRDPSQQPENGESQENPTESRESDSRQSNEGKQAKSSEPESSESESPESESPESQQTEPEPSESQESPSESSSPSQPSNPFSGLSDWIPGLGVLLKGLVFIVLGGIVAAYLWMNRHMLAEFWRGLFETSDDDETTTFEQFLKQEQTAPPQPFAAYRKPSAGQTDPRKQIVIAFSALDAWCREADLPRGPDETPNEFLTRLQRRFPPLNSPAGRLVNSYNHVIYGRGMPSGQDLQAADQLWAFMTTTKPATLATQKSASGVLATAAEQ